MRQTLRFSVIASALTLLFSVCVSAQEMTAEEKKAEKEFNESMEKEVDRLTNLLDLDDWQVFYVDSILNHDYRAMQAELKELQNKKVSNSDIYYEVQYKWQDKMYEAYQGVFDEKQWAKYLKSGAEREKRNRDKKRNKSK